MRFFCSSYCVLGKSSIPTTNIGSRSLQTASSKFGFLIYISKHAHFSEGRLPIRHRFSLGFIHPKPQKLMMSTPFKVAVASFPGQAVVAAAAAARVARAAQGAGRRQAARVVRMWLGLFPSHASDWAANHRDV